MPPVAVSVLTIKESEAAVLVSAIMLVLAALMDAAVALLLAAVTTVVSSDNVALDAIATDRANASATFARADNAVVMELAKLGLLPNAAAISTSVFRLSGAPFSSADVFPSKYEAVAFNASADDSAVTLVLSALSADCNDAYVDATAPDTEATDATRVETSALSAVLSAVFVSFSDATESAIAAARDTMPLCRFAISVESVAPRVASVAVKFATTVATAVLADNMALARCIVSGNRAPFSAPSASENDTDALLNALDSDATALTRLLVSVDRALIKPASTAESDGTAVLLKDATALMRVAISLDTAALNELTWLITLLVSVTRGLVWISLAIFSSVFIWDGAPLNTLAMAADMALERAAASFANPSETDEFPVTRDDTATEAAEAMEAI